LPDVEDGADDRLAGLHVPKDTVHKSDTAMGIRVLDDAVAESAEGGVGRPEGAENDVGGRGDTVLGDDLVGDLIDETMKSVSFHFCFLGFLHFYFSLRK
jgi:hypothetical protein